MEYGVLVVIIDSGLAPRNGKYKEKYLHTMAKRKGKSKIRI